MKTKARTGILMIIGGGEDRERKMVVLREFVRLAGGPRARIVLMTAASEAPEEYDEQYRAAFGKIGVEDFRTLMTDTRDDAERAKAVGVVEQATGVFFTGGDQKRLYHILHDTELEKAIRRRLAGGMVLAGTSAGASMMSEVMLDEGEAESCPRVGGVSLAPGMGFLPGVLIDQHFAQRGRLGRLLTALAERPDDLAVGIGEDTAMIVERETFRTVGSGVVTVIDAAGLSYNNRPSAKPDEPLTLGGLALHTVSSGHAFDLKARSMIPGPRAEAVA